MTKRIYLIIFLYAFCLQAICANNVALVNDMYVPASDSIALFFKFDNATLDTSYRDNSANIRKLDAMLSRYENLLDSVKIVAYASVEGNVNYNMKLSSRRAKAVYNYLSNKYPFINSRVALDCEGVGENWDGLLQEVLSLELIPERETLINMLSDTSLAAGQREQRIKELANGSVYKFLNSYVFWKQRSAVSVLLWHNGQPRALLPQTIMIAAPVSNSAEFALAQPRTIEEYGMPYKVRKPLLALKTNLLYDLCSGLNVSVEVPIQKHWSVAGEWLFPFWKKQSAKYTFEILYSQLDLKYWLGNRDYKRVMTGWFCDVYGGYGKYDFQFFSNSGSQGNLFNVGVGGGYAQSIRRNLRMEYALGLGYARAHYHKYDMAFDTQYGDIKVVRYPWVKRYYNWIGPTKASISLVWLINTKRTIKETR
ncbi:MAG: DUF3575 domain-containing protein [Marinifilaceae bacterium]